MNSCLNLNESCRRIFFISWHKYCVNCTSNWVTLHQPPCWALMTSRNIKRPACLRRPLNRQVFRYDLCLVFFLPGLLYSSSLVCYRCFEISCRVWMIVWHIIGWYFKLLANSFKKSLIETKNSTFIVCAVENHLSHMSCIVNST